MRNAYSSLLAPKPSKLMLQDRATLPGGISKTITFMDGTDTSSGVLMQHLHLSEVLLKPFVSNCCIDYY